MRVDARYLINRLVRVPGSSGARNSNLRRASANRGRVSRRLLGMHVRSGVHYPLHPGCVIYEASAIAVLLLFIGFGVPHFSGCLLWKSSFVSSRARTRFTLRPFVVWECSKCLAQNRAAGCSIRPYRPLAENPFYDIILGLRIVVPTHRWGGVIEEGG